MLRFKPSDFATFTDRDTQIAAFHRLLGDSAEARVYVFGGLSGNGKSFLVDYLILHELPQGTPYALVDFEAVPGLVTDAATWADSLIPVLEPLPRRAVKSFHSTLASTMARLSEGLRSLQIRQTVNVRGDSRTDIHQDISLSGLVEELYKVARREIANALIALARTGSQGRAPRVLFLDGYEFLRRDDERYETWIWSVLHRLLDVAPGLRIVVAGRESPRQQCIATEPDTLLMFTLEQSRSYLRQSNVGDSCLQEALFALTSGHPLLLWMAARLATGNAPLTLYDLEIAPGAREDCRPVAAWLYGRILNRLPEEQQELGELAALLRRFDAGILAGLVDTPQTPAFTQKVRAFVQAHTAWISPHPQGGWAVHDLVRRARIVALSQDGPEAEHAFHERAEIAWRKRYGLTRQPDDIAEALYHSFFTDEPRAMEEWGNLVGEHTLIADRHVWRTVVLVPSDVSLAERPLSANHVAEASYHQGCWYYYGAEWDAALETYQQALGLFRQVGARLGEANTLQSIGLLYAQVDDMDTALAYLHEAHALHSAIHDRYSCGVDSFYRAEILASLGRPTEACADLEFALEVFTELQLPYADWARTRLEALHREQQPAR